MTATTTTRKAIGAYRTADKGWAAYDREGVTWRVSEEEAQAINAKA